MISSKFPVVWCYFFSETIFPWWKILALWRHWKRKKDLFFINRNSFRVPPANFLQFPLSMGFSCNKLLLSLSFKHPRVKLHLLYFKAKNFWKFFGLAADIQKQRTQNVKKICEPEIKVLHFFRYHFVMCTFLSQIAAFTELYVSTSKITFIFSKSKK